MSQPKLNINDIHLNKVVSLNEALNNNVDIEDKELSVMVAQSIMHNMEDSMFKVTISVEITYETTNIGRYEYDYLFVINNLENYFNMENDEPIFHKILIVSMLGIAYSTFRGILIGKLAESNFKDLILPVIDPNSLLESKLRKADEE